MSFKGKWPLIILILLFAFLLPYWCATRASGANEEHAAAPSAGAASLDRADIIRQMLDSSVKVILGEEKDGAVSEAQSSSGVVIYSERKPKPWTLILTNAHAVTGEKGSGSPGVFMSYVASTGRRLLRAKVVAKGDMDKIDLALVRVEGITLPAAQFENMDQVRLGSPILVASSPFGREISITSGIISQLYLSGPPAVEKACQTGDKPPELCLKPKPLEEVFKTDAPICYGSSGGGVFLLASGRLVGLVESYQSADVIIRPKAGEEYKIQIPVPGESFLISVNKIKYFLKENGMDTDGHGQVLANCAQPAQQKSN
jgi:S1-C subfamily serine protease